MKKFYKKYSRLIGAFIFASLAHINIMNGQEGLATLAVVVSLLSILDFVVSRQG